MSPVCVPCKREMKCSKTGAAVVENLSDGTPYRLWMTDFYKCGGCGHEVIGYFAQHAVAVHHEPDFKDKVERYQVTLAFDGP